MLSKKDFISPWNYYLVLLLHYCIKPLFFIQKLFVKTNKGSKNKILIIELGHLGDMLMATPAIKLIRDTKSDAEIVCICSQSGAAALKGNPSISGIEVIETPPWYETDRRGLFHVVKGLFAFIAVMKRHKADCVLNFRSVSYHFDHIAAWRSGIPERIGHGGKGLDYLLTYKANLNEKEPIPFQKIRLVSDWLGLPAQLNSAQPLFYNDGFNSSAISRSIEDIQLGSLTHTIAINMGAQHTFLWPEENYVALCRKIHKQYACKILFIGMEQHVPGIEAIRNKLDFVTYSVAGKTSLNELYWILEKVRLLITVDTGVRHLANAAGIPVLVLRHAADEVISFGRYTENEQVLFHATTCSPCGKKVCPLGTLECMTGISVAAVFEKVVNTMNSRAGKERPQKIVK